MKTVELFQIYNLKEILLGPELFLSCSIFQFTFYAISTNYQRKTKFIILNKQVYAIGILFAILSFFLILNEDLFTQSSFYSDNFLIYDYFGFIGKLVTCVVFILFFLIISVSFQNELIENNFEYVVLVIVSILALLVLCSSNDLITAYLSIELHSVAFYIMAAFKRSSSYSIESGLKYFIIGALSSTLFLFGSAIIYGSTGSLSFDDLKILLSLLFLTTIEIILLFFPKVLEMYTDTDLFLISYQKYQINFAVSSFTNIYVIYASTESKSVCGLIDWCVQNNFRTVFVILPESFLNMNFYNSFKALELTQKTVYSPWILCLYSLNSMSIQSTFITYNYVWCNLLIYNKLDFNFNLLLLQQIFTAYNSAQLNKTILSLSMFNNDLISIAFIFICISLFIKLSVAPFHLWIFDVYEGSPNSTTFFFSVVPKVALFIILLRICYVGFYSIFINYQIYFFLLAILSVFIGSIGGLKQRKLKTLLAYSSISHTGYLLISFSVGNIEGIQMSFYYLFIYVFSIICFWSVYLFLRQKQEFYLKKLNKELGDLTLLKNSNPTLALILIISLFSIAGIPPVVGFLAKISVFTVLVNSSAFLVSILCIFFSIISTFYYVRLVKISCFENILVGKLYKPIRTKKALLICLLLFILVILFVDPITIYFLFYKAILLL